jgi:DHA2 family multidrug resistance protein
MLMTSLSLYTMTQYSLYINEWQIIAPGIVQGIGIGLAYVPLSTLAFSTLPKAFQNEGAAFFNLMRNLGSSIGISVVETILTRNTQIVHATLSEHITPFQSYATTATPHALAMLNAMLTDQAMMIAYLDDFKLMMIVTLAMLPFIFIMKLPKHLDTSNEKIMME